MYLCGSFYVKLKYVTQTLVFTIPYSIKTSIMQFYTAIAEHYESIFPFNAQQLIFIEHNAPSSTHTKLIEIGSARGSLTSACANAGYQVQGLELDNNMVKLAQVAYPSIPFFAENMLEMDQVFAKNTANVMVCFGNTLVHLTHLEQMQTFLNKAYKILRRNGKLLIQFINYDRIIEQSIKALPTIENKDITFVRDYQLISDSQLDFTVTLTIHQSGEKIQNTQQLYPLRKVDFEQMAQKAGFKTEAFTSFKGEAWHLNGMQSIFVCR